MNNDQIEVVYVIDSEISKKDKPYVTFEWTSRKERHFYPTQASDVRLAQLLLRLPADEWSMITNNGYTIVSRDGFRERMLMWEGDNGK